MLELLRFVRLALLPVSTRPLRVDTHCPSHESIPAFQCPYSVRREVISKGTQAAPLLVSSGKLSEVQNLLADGHSEISKVMSASSPMIASPARRVA